jgi:S-layer family protein
MKTGSNTSSRSYHRAMALVALMTIITAASMRLQADTGDCGGASITLPFTDVAATNIFFCSIASAYFTGLTNGTTASTYSPSDPVTREQMAAFVTRTLDQSLKRGSRRAALGQWWTLSHGDIAAKTPVGNFPIAVASDGADLWVANYGRMVGQFDSSVSQVRASDGKVIEAWDVPNSAYQVLVAAGMVFMTGASTPGMLYKIEPAQGGGAATIVSDSLGPFPYGLTFDGERIWTANFGAPGVPTDRGSVSIYHLGGSSATTITSPFNRPNGIVFDGANIWVTDYGANTLLKLDSGGNIIQTVYIGTNPRFPVFDGTNIWIPNEGSNSVTVVRASTGAVLATLSGNELNFPTTAAFDGERILVTNRFGHSVSLWKAADLTPLGSFDLGGGVQPWGACSDGLSFWITLAGTDALMRF